ncbi:copper resistance protein NlpE [Leyella stercorea]|uniref:copper resistance protein NlpE n=1 Tax=Leyella stercorea TaxID=363265 RepID=UPI00242B85DC|nr:copper resistance protein NlpE [Leyella stercorea]
MKKNLMILAVAALAVFASCSDKKAARSVVGKDTTSVVGNTASDKNNLDLASVAGTYEGTFPAADGSGIKTVLTIKADGTYQIEQDYIDQKDGHDEASGVFKVLDDNVLMLVRPSSGEHTFYKVKDDNNIVMTDSVGNEPECETAKHYVLKKRK